MGVRSADSGGSACFAPEALVGVSASTRLGVQELDRDRLFQLEVERCHDDAHTAGSEHVARVLDIEVLDNHLPYIVMELLEGHDLEHELELAGPLPMAVAVGYLLQAIDDARCVDECEMLVDAGASNKYSVPAAQKGGNTLKCRILHAVKALTDPESADASSYCRAAIGEAPCNRFGRC